MTSEPGGPQGLSSDGCPPSLPPRQRFTATFMIRHNAAARIHRTTTSSRPVPTPITQASSGPAIPRGSRSHVTNPALPRVLAARARLNPGRCLPRWSR
jgi:hypothetical protein